MIHARNDYQTRIQDSENKIPADEPVFLLRAQDQVAAATLRHWIRLQKKALKGVPKEKQNGAIKAIKLAEAQAYRFDDWQTKKVADVP